MELSRREVIRALIAAVGVSGVQALVGCGSSTNASGGLTVTSSSTNGHTHEFTITKEELSNPANISRNDSDNGHSHLVTLTAAQVNLIGGGSPITLTSGGASGHTHNYTFILS